MLRCAAAVGNVVVVLMSFAVRVREGGREGGRVSLLLFWCMDGRVGGYEQLC